MASLPILLNSVTLNNGRDRNGAMEMGFMLAFLLDNCGLEARFDSF